MPAPESHTALPETVVLIHGLYMQGFCMTLLAKRLRQMGYRTVIFSYPSLRGANFDTVRKLADRVRATQTPTVHYVAHSLGGLLVRHLVATTPDLPPGLVVTLGTPHRGSDVARRLHAGPLRKVLGDGAAQCLIDEAPPWPPDRLLGSIAGTLNVGMGRFLTRLSPPADGTVQVAETRFPGMSDHIRLPVNHTGLLLSAEVAAQVRAFLRAGRFIHEPVTA